MARHADPSTAQAVAALEDVQAGGGLYVAFAVLREAREGRTRNDDPFIDISVGDLSANIGGKIWPDQREAQASVRQLACGTPVKVLFHAEEYRDTLQLRVVKIREARADDDGFDPSALFGEGHELVSDLLCQHIAFDIETVPAVDRRSLPSTVAESLARAAERKDSDEAKVMGLSPFFGKVVALAVGDAEAEDPEVTVFVVPKDGQQIDDPPPWMRPVTEQQLLQAWWALADHADTVISYNGRGFDVPFLVSRSLIHGIPARVDLMSNRYSLRPHLDLYRAISQGERPLGPANLDVVCWALDIDSPKEQMDGSMVAPAYERGEIEEIARYNALDVQATIEVYRKLRDGVLRFRKDW